MSEPPQTPLVGNRTEQIRYGRKCPAPTPYHAWRENRCDGVTLHNSLPMMATVTVMIAAAIARDVDTADDLVPLSSVRAADAAVTLRFETTVTRSVPYSASLLLANPTATAIAVGVAVDAQPLAPMSVPPGFARRLRVHCPPRIQPFRVGLRIHSAADPSGTWVYSPTIERPHDLVACPPSADSGPFLSHVGFDESPGGGDAILLLAGVPMAGEPWSFSGDDFGHPIGYRVQQLRDDTWVEHHLSFRGQCARQHEVPPALAMPFTVRPPEPRLPMRIGLRLNGSLCWTDRIDPPSRFKPLGADVPIGPPATVFAQFGKDFEYDPAVWFAIENRAERPLRVRAVRQRDPLVRVQIAQGSGLIDRLSPAGTKPSYGDSDLEIPPRTRLYVSSHAWSTREPMRAGVILSNPLAQPRILWSEVVEVPPSSGD